MGYIALLLANQKRGISRVNDKDTYCLEFISHRIKETLHVNTNSKENQS